MVITDAYLTEREHSLVELGFTPDQACELARARDPKGFLVEIHAIRRTLECGANTAQAFDIHA